MSTTSVPSAIFLNSTTSLIEGTQFTLHFIPTLIVDGPATTYTVIRNSSFRFNNSTSIFTRTSHTLIVDNTIISDTSFHVDRPASANQTTAGDQLSVAVSLTSSTGALFTDCSLDRHIQSPIQTSAYYRGVVVQQWFPLSSNLIFRRCNFTNSFAYSGTVYAATAGTTIQFEECYFINNTALTRGSVIEVINRLITIVLFRSTFINNNNIAVVAGGGISGLVLVDGCTFIGQPQYAIQVSFAFGTRSIQIRNSLFIGNKGAINIWGQMMTRVSNCTFIENDAVTGAGILVNLQATTTLSNNTFIRNRANQGGGIFIDVGSQATISGSTFIGNTAKQGGALFDASKSVLINNVFDGNSADKGGAIFYMDPYLNSFHDVTRNFIQATIAALPPCAHLYQHLVFTRNRANVGGAIYLDGQAPICTGFDACGNLRIPANWNATFSSNSTYDLTVSPSGWPVDRSGELSLLTDTQNGFESSQCYFSQNVASSLYGNNIGSTFTSCQLVGLNSFASQELAVNLSRLDSA